MVGSQVSSIVGLVGSIGDDRSICRGIGMNLSEFHSLSDVLAKVLGQVMRRIGSMVG